MSWVVDGMDDLGMVDTGMIGWIKGWMDIGMDIGMDGCRNGYRDIGMDIGMDGPEGMSG